MLGISKDREWSAIAPRVGLLNRYCAGKRPRTGWSNKPSIWRRHSKMPRYACAKDHSWHLHHFRHVNNMSEVAPDIQTGKQYSSTGRMNAQKHLATTAASPKTLIVFLKIPILLEAEAPISLTWKSREQPSTDKAQTIRATRWVGLRVLYK